MPERFHTLVLSPHLDDAVLSCGGLLHDLARAGARCLVATVFAGDPPPGPVSEVVADLRRWTGLGADAEEVRRQEDSRALARLGVERLHLPFPESIHRRAAGSKQPLYPSLGALFREPAPEDQAIEAELVDALLHLPAHERVLAPLAIGRHVDHVLLRRAAERAFPGGLLHYEDFPYCRKWSARRRALGWWARGWQAECVALSDPAMQARIEATRCYGSQLGALFGNLDRVERALRADMSRVGGERLWRRVGG